MKLGAMILGLLLTLAYCGPALAQDKGNSELDLFNNTPLPTCPAKSDCDNGRCSVTRTRTVIRQRRPARRVGRVAAAPFRFLFGRRGCRGCK